MARHKKRDTAFRLHAARRSRTSAKPIEAFLWGLLPDNAAVSDRWARKFQCSARNPFALISHVGEDCAGAVQFVRLERVEVCIAPVSFEGVDHYAEIYREVGEAMHDLSEAG